MTAPEPPAEEPIEIARDTSRAWEEPEPVPREENAIIGWARAIVGGVRDTARDMVDEGRRGAREAYDQRWRDFDGKTKYRRKGPK
jgi:hypothetical protein